MAQERSVLKKALFDELRKVNEQLKFPQTKFEERMLKAHKDFVQHIIDICVDRNRF